MSAVFRLTIKILIAEKIIFYKFLLSVFLLCFVELFWGGRDKRKGEKERKEEREYI